MNVIIKKGCVPTNVFGPPLPFVWLGNLTVRARKKGHTVIVPIKSVIKQLRKKDVPHGVRFANFFSNGETKKMIFTLDAVTQISR